MRNKPNLYYGPPGDPATMLYGSQAHVIPQAALNFSCSSQNPTGK